MQLHKNIISIIPKFIMSLLRPVVSIFGLKYFIELLYWKRSYKTEGASFDNQRYQRIMLSMAEETDDTFMKDKIVADFGCGPRGSLHWANSAKIRIGIDVLADRYADHFKQSIITHNMIYLKATEKVIPLPSNFVDIMFTLNAIDHVDSFGTMCNVVLRVLKPGGIFIGSFNLEEPPTFWEPQTLNPKIVESRLLNKLEILSYRISNQGPNGNEYEPFFKDELNYNEGEEGFLWVKGIKR